MKLLTAAALTQGQRDNDYDWCAEGEFAPDRPVTVQPREVDACTFHELDVH